MNTTGRFNYLVPAVKSSLYRNGEVLIHRDADGSDTGMEGVDLEEREMPVYDGRCLEADAWRTVERNGFELLPRPLADPSLDFLHHEDVVRRYYPACVEIVRAATGAPKVYAFDHNIRSAAGKQTQQRIAGGQQVQGPAHVAHGDYTLASAPQRLSDLVKPPSGNDTVSAILETGQALLDPADVDRALRGGARYAILNVWRNIANEPVATHPMALCDAQSVDPGDLVVFEIHYRDRVGENYFAKHAARHRWYTYPAMTRDEVLLIKQWDSAGTLARSAGARPDADDDSTSTFSFHSAFEDPETPPDAPERWSIEVRCVVLYA